MHGFVHRHQAHQLGKLTFLTQCLDLYTPVMICTNVVFPVVLIPYVCDVRNQGSWRNLRRQLEFEVFYAGSPALIQRFTSKVLDSASGSPNPDLGRKTWNGDPRIISWELKG